MQSGVLLSEGGTLIRFILGKGEVVFGSPATDGFVFDQFFGDDFDGGPGGLVREQVLGFIEELVNELAGLAWIAGAGHRELFNVAKVLGRALDIVAPGLASFSSHAGEEEKDLSLQLVLNLLGPALLDGAGSQSVFGGDDTDLLDVPPHEERHHGVSRFVIGREGSIMFHRF